jgi:hypothetical protein
MMSRESRLQSAERRVGQSPKLLKPVMVRICKDEEAVVAARAEYAESAGKFRKLVLIRKKDFSKSDTVRYGQDK